MLVRPFRGGAPGAIGNARHAIAQFGSASRGMAMKPAPFDYQAPSTDIEPRLGPTIAIARAGSLYFRHLSPARRGTMSSYPACSSAESSANFLEPTRMGGCAVPFRTNCLRRDPG